mgnify:CR=1 FL=1
MGKKTKTKKKQWTSREMQLLLKYKADGLDSGEIANCLGRSQKAVQHKISEMRTPKPVPETVFPTEENSKPFSLDRSKVKKYAIWGGAILALGAALLAERLL